MNIALFASAFHPSLGGVEELCRQLAHHLKAAEKGVMIATNRWPKNLPAVEVFEGLDLHRYVFRVPENTWKQRLGSAVTGPLTQRKLFRDLKRTRTDILHVQCVSSNCYYALKAQQALKIPLVVSLQGELTMDASGLFQRSAFARTLMRTALERATIITACSRQTLEEAEAFYGSPFGERGRVIYNGIRYADFEGVQPYSHARPYILGIGRHVPQKGFDVLLRAYANASRVDEAFPDLILAGDGECHEQLKALARELGLEGRVHFVGRADRKMTAALFAGATVFVLPSRHEPMGIVNLEAMAAGKPVIASRVGGVPELVLDGETGILFEGGNVDELTTALEKIVSDPHLAACLSDAGAKRAAQFDWKRITTEYISIYEELLTGRKVRDKQAPSGSKREDVRSVVGAH